MNNSFDCGTGAVCTCGCCEGIEIAVPQNTTNRPGLPALAYRIGTHATFLETMIARLSSSDYPALAALKTRDPADFSIALLDSWSVVADVLTFYQERIANEGYLRTATERRSIIELARLIGYKLRLGVSATVYLAYTLDEDRSKNPPLPTRTLISAGSRSQSVPGPGQLPQSFETSLELDARSEWNSLKPRLTEPQRFTLSLADGNLGDMGTDAALRDAVYFSGISTNLKPGDPLLFILGSGTGQQVLRLVQAVEVQSDQKRTEVILQTGSIPVPTNINSTDLLKQIYSDATSIYAGSNLSSQIAALLQIPKDSPPGTALGLLDLIGTNQGISQDLADNFISQVQQFHDLAVKRNFTRLEPWLAQLLDILPPQLQLLVSGSTNTIAANVGSFSVNELVSDKIDYKPLISLTALLPRLAAPPSIQPPSSLQLARSLRQTFSSKSDMAPRLLGAFIPAAAQVLYQAWSNLGLVATTTQVGAIRVKAGLFPGSYPGVPTSKLVSNSDTARITSFDNSPTINSAWQSLLAQNGNDFSLSSIALDSVYDKITIGSWIMIDRPVFPTAGDKETTSRTQTFHKVIGVTTAAMTTDDFGFSAKVTQLTLDPPWLKENNARNLRIQTGLLSGTIVYAQIEVLELAEEPLDIDIAGDTIELDRAYDGLESGRWIIVSGERTDIPNVTGVTASELVMLQGVAQVTTSPNGQTTAVHTKLTLANKLAYTYDIDTVVIYGNVVKATHGETRNEALGNGDGSQVFQSFALKQKPLTFVPASNPSGTDSTLEVYVNNVKWQEADTLAGLGAKDRDFITQTADDDGTAVTFGNGLQGARLPTGVGNVSAVYRNGIGQPGNVDANQISLLQTRPLNVKAVINPLRASGGADRDSRDQARRNAPLAVMALDRLVSVQDYADFARTFAGIGKASSARLSDGQRDLVHVTVAGANDIPIDHTSDLYANLVQALQVNGDLYLPIVVAVRQLKLLVISANVKIRPDYLWEPVATAVRTALVTAFSFDNRELGQPAFASEVISVIQGVAGVAYVDLDKFDSVAEGLTAAQLAGLANTIGLQDYVISSLALPNPRPVNPPADNILAAELAYLTPAIPDTLILNQVKL